MLRMTAVVCVLAAPVCGAGIAVAASEAAAKKHQPKKLRAPSRCAGASMTAVDEASRRRASKVVMCLVNRARRANGRRPLRRSRSLAQAALRHSIDMVAGTYFSHFSASGDVRRRAIRAGYVRRRSTGLLGETLAWGAGSGATPGQLVAGLMSSRSHRRTLLRRRYREIGVGLVLGAPATNVGAAAATLTVALGRR